MGACATKPATKEGEAPLPAKEEAKVEAVKKKDKELAVAEAEAESGQQSLSMLLSQKIEVEVKKIIAPEKQEANSTEPAASRAVVVEPTKADDKRLTEKPAEPPKEKVDGNKKEMPTVIVIEKEAATQLPASTSSKVEVKKTIALEKPATAEAKSTEPAASKLVVADPVKPDDKRPAKKPTEPPEEKVDNTKKEKLTVVVDSEKGGAAQLLVSTSSKIV